MNEISIMRFFVPRSEFVFSYDELVRLIDPTVTKRQNVAEFLIQTYRMVYRSSDHIDVQVYNPLNACRDYQIQSKGLYGMPKSRTRYMYKGRL